MREQPANQQTIKSKEYDFMYICGYTFLCEK